MPGMYGGMKGKKKKKKKPTRGRQMARRFAKVPKTKRGVPVKYVRGAKNKKATEDEIKSTAKKYREGTLTKAEMDEISKKRAKSGKKKSKKKRKKQQCENTR